MREYALILMLAVWPSGSALAQWLPTPATDPTEFGSLALDPSEAMSMNRGEWASVFTTSYFNQWGGSWHTARVHQDRGLERQPIEDDELEYLQAAFPDDEIFRFDIEGWRADLVLARGFERGLTLSARLPYVHIGGPNWDSVAETVHTVLPENPAYARYVFARNQTFLYLHTSEQTILRRSELDGGGVGDVVFSLAAPLRKTSASEQRVALSIKAPTGDEQTLRGSGGWDLGVRLFSAWSGRRREYLVGAAYNYLGRGGSFFGAERGDTWNVFAELTQGLTRRVSGVANVRIESSPLASVTRTPAGRPVFYYRLGAVVAVDDRKWVAFQLGEELLPQIGIDADWSFHLLYGARSGGLRR